MIEFGDLCENPEPHVGHMRQLENGEQILCEGRLEDARQRGDVSPFAQRVRTILESAQTTYADRNAVYKDNFRTVGRVMSALFPDGAPTLLTTMDFDRWHIFELDIVKLTRYVANWHSPDADSLLDRIPYLGILGGLDAEMREQRAEPKSVTKVRMGGKWHDIGLPVKIDPREAGLYKPTAEESIQQAVSQLVDAGLTLPEAKKVASEAVAMFRLEGESRKDWANDSPTALDDLGDNPAAEELAKVYEDMGEPLFHDHPRSVPERLGCKACDSRKMESWAPETAVRPGSRWCGERAADHYAESSIQHIRESHGIVDWKAVAEARGIEASEFLEMEANRFASAVSARLNNPKARAWQDEMQRRVKEADQLGDEKSRIRAEEALDDLR